MLSSEIESLDKQNLVTDSRKESELIEHNVEENQLLNSNKSKEKILHLQGGAAVWRKVCLIFGISAVVFIVSIVVASVQEITLLYILSGLSGLVVFFCIIFSMCSFCFFVTILPNEAIVYQYYGRYLGTVKDNGYFFGYPFAKTFRLSLRSMHYNGNRLEVNERDGNPVELGIIIVWKIGDTAKAIFDVENYSHFIEAQAEAAIRYIGCKYPYEPTKPGEISLTSGAEIINKQLRDELERRIAVSGILIEDARITEIAYRQDVALMMLQRQASKALVFSKDAVIKGATKAVINTLKEFEKNGVKMNNHEKVSYITETMNALCIDSRIHKIVT